MGFTSWLKELTTLVRARAAAAETRRVALAGSEFVPVAGASRKWLPKADERIQVTVVLRPARAVPDRSVAAAGHGTPGAGAPLSRAEFARRHAAPHASADRVAEFATRHGLEVLERSETRHRVVLAGSRSAMAEVFGIKFVHYKHESGEHRGFKGAVQIPAELQDCVEAVLGLNDEPLAQPRCPLDHHGGSGAARLSATELIDLYGAPESDGSGQCIGIVALAGGYLRQDIEDFFQAEGIPVPKITEVFVDDGFDKSGTNRPAPPKELDALARRLGGDKKKKVTDRAWHTLETTMDIELLGAFAPGAHLVVYFAPSNTADGLINTLSYILDDEENDPAVVSMSWGWPEYQHINSSLFADSCAPEPVLAPLLISNAKLSYFVEIGVTICVASGDDLARDLNQRPGVQFPGSSPHALACGGTSIKTAAGRGITSEKVWHEGEFGSGGGVSRIFERPYWQQGLEIPHPPGCGHRAGRGVPDVAAVADRETGCRIVVGGHELTSAGTSAVAPLWAALIARMYAELGLDRRFLTPELYRIGAEDPSTFRATAESDNGFYCATEGALWNPCTGLGGPVGDRLTAALRELRRPRAEASRDVGSTTPDRKPGSPLSPP